MEFYLSDYRLPPCFNCRILLQTCFDFGGLFPSKSGVENNSYTNLTVSVAAKYVITESGFWTLFHTFVHLFSNCKNIGKMLSPTIINCWRKNPSLDRHVLTIRSRHTLPRARVLSNGSHKARSHLTCWRMKPAVFRQVLTIRSRHTWEGHELYRSGIQVTVAS